MKTVKVLSELSTARAVPVTISLDFALLARLDAYASRRGVRRSAVVTLAVMRELDRLETEHELSTICGGVRDVGESIAAPAHAGGARDALACDE